MRSFLYVVMFFISCAAGAANLSLPDYKRVSMTQFSLDLRDVRLVDLAQVVYGDIKGRSLIFDSSFISDSELVSVVMKSKSPDLIEHECTALLLSHGYEARVANGVVHISQEALPPDARKMYYFHPRYRSVSYLLSMVKFAFPKGEFLGENKSVPLSIAQVQGNVGAAMPPPPAIAQQGVNSLASSDLDVVIFRGSADDVAMLDGVLKELDQPLGEVVVDAAVFEVSAVQSNVSAVDMVVRILSGSAGLVQNMSAAGSPSSFYLKGGALSGVVAALSSDSHFKMMTSPRLRVRSGASARFTVGASVPVLGQVSMSSTGQPVQSVEYKNSGVIFSVSPVVRGELVDLTIDQQISSFVQTTNGVNNSPTLTMRQLSSDVQLHDDELVVIGGLDQDSENDGNSHLPFLPAWLGSSSSGASHSQIVLLLHVQKI